MNPLQQAIRRLADGESLSSTDAAAAFDVVMAGDGTPVQVASLLTALRVKGETPEEIAGAARALRNAMRAVTLDALCFEATFSDSEKRSLHLEMSFSRLPSKIPRECCNHTAFFG